MMGWFLVLLGFIAFLWSAVDIANRKDIDSGTKIIWFLVVLCFGLIGVVVYIIASDRDCCKAKSKKKR